MVLEKPASAGFFVLSIHALGGACLQVMIDSLSIEFRRCPLGNFRTQFQ